MISARQNVCINEINIIIMQRKIVIATNVAESSLTIDGINMLSIVGMS